MMGATNTLHEHYGGHTVDPRGSLGLVAGCYLDTNNHEPHYLNCTRHGRAVTGLLDRPQPRPRIRTDRFSLRYPVRPPGGLRLVFRPLIWQEDYYRDIHMHHLLLAPACALLHGLRLCLGTVGWFDFGGASRFAVAATSTTWRILANGVTPIRTQLRYGSH